MKRERNVEGKEEREGGGERWGEKKEKKVGGRGVCSTFSASLPPNLPGPIPGLDSSWVPGRESLVATIDPGPILVLILVASYSDERRWRLACHPGSFPKLHLVGKLGKPYVW